MKYWKLLFIIFTLLIAIFCLIPYLYQGITRQNADWQAWWAFGTFLVAVFAFMVAWREYQIHAHEAQEQSRAYIQVEYYFDLHFLYVCVRNVGKTAAKEIGVNFTPALLPPKGDNDEKDNAQYLFKKGLIDRKISIIPPGSRFLYIIDETKKIQDHINEGLIPETTHALVSYKDIHNNEYNEDYCLDLGDWKYTVEDFDPLITISEGLKSFQENGIHVKNTKKRIIPPIDLMPDSSSELAST